MPIQLPLDLPHRASLSRDDLIVTSANALAVSAVDGWRDWSHPVLLVVGPPGSGKSHLASAWARMAGAFIAGPGDGAPGEDFAAVLDDVDRSSLSEGEMFRLINAARLGGGHVLATARRRPEEMGLNLPDLRSRLKAATTIELGRPDDALLSGVLSKLFSDRQLVVDPRLVAYICARMERSLDVASRLVGAIDREALASKEKVSRPLIQRILADRQFTDASDCPNIAREESVGEGAAED